MISRWNDEEAAKCGGDPLKLRVYTSRLLGCEPDLVLHGGGNTSVKAPYQNFFKERIDALFVKGSGWDLATIEEEGFPPLRLKETQRLAEIEELSDPEMVRLLRAALLEPYAPNPSIEAIVHAIIPYTFVDHTHSDAVVALTNTPDSGELLKACYGDSVLVLPYVKPGFVLAKQFKEAASAHDGFSGYKGVVLENHGIFTYAEDARAAYENMIELVTKAEEFIADRGARVESSGGEAEEDLVRLAELRGIVSRARGKAVLAKLDASPEAVNFSKLPNIGEIASRGCLTPEHVIRTKRRPVIVGEDLDADVAAFVSDYGAYFNRNKTPELEMLDPAPRWAVWPGKGTVSFGRSEKENRMISDIGSHTARAIQWAEALGGWKPLPEADLFDIEYWELEQAKLKKAGEGPSLQGKVAIVSGAAAGIGLAIAQCLAEAGAMVVGIDLNPKVEEQLRGPNTEGRICDVTDADAMREIVEDTVRRFGGLDILVNNAGIFTAGQYIEKLEERNWEKSLAVNLTSHQRMVKSCVPYLRHGVDPTIIFIGSRNFRAPGAGAASYSVAKAGIVQLARVAALELAPENVRVNVVHPDAVFDTELWTEENLKRSAERYNMTVEEYKTRNLMKTEIKSRDVGLLVATMADRPFLKTTGCQVSIDGGNDRVI